jgi:hypothetical protein
VLKFSIPEALGLLLASVTNPLWFFLAEAQGVGVHRPSTLKILSRCASAVELRLEAKVEKALNESSVGQSARWAAAAYGTVGQSARWAAAAYGTVGQSARWAAAAYGTDRILTRG